MVEIVRRATISSALWETMPSLRLSRDVTFWPSTGVITQSDHCRRER
jgi:hypothetical protein